MSNRSNESVFKPPPQEILGKREFVRAAKTGETLKFGKNRAGRLEVTLNNKTKTEINLTLKNTSKESPFHVWNKESHITTILPGEKYNMVIARNAPEQQKKVEIRSIGKKRTAWEVDLNDDKVKNIEQKRPQRRNMLKMSQLPLVERQCNLQAMREQTKMLQGFARRQRVQIEQSFVKQQNEQLLNKQPSERPVEKPISKIPPIETPIPKIPLEKPQHVFAQPRQERIPLQEENRKVDPIPEKFIKQESPPRQNTEIPSLVEKILPTAPVEHNPVQRLPEKSPIREIPLPPSPEKQALPKEPVENIVLPREQPVQKPIPERLPSQNTPRKETFSSLEKPHTEEKIPASEPLEKPFPQQRKEEQPRQEQSSVDKQEIPKPETNPPEQQAIPREKQDVVFRPQQGERIKEALQQEEKILPSPEYNVQEEPPREPMRPKEIEKDAIEGKEKEERELQPKVLQEEKHTPVSEISIQKTTSREVRYHQFTKALRREKTASLPDEQKMSSLAERAAAKTFIALLKAEQHQEQVVSNEENDEEGVIEKEQTTPEISPRVALEEKILSKQYDTTKEKHEPLPADIKDVSEKLPPPARDKPLHPVKIVQPRVPEEVIEKPLDDSKKEVLLPPNVEEVGKKAQKPIIIERPIQEPEPQTEKITIEQQPLSPVEKTDIKTPAVEQLPPQMQREKFTSEKIPKDFPKVKEEKIKDTLELAIEEEEEDAIQATLVNLIIPDVVTQLADLEQTREQRELSKEESHRFDMLGFLDGMVTITLKQSLSGSVTKLPQHFPPQRLMHIHKTFLRLGNTVRREIPPSSLTLDKYKNVVGERAFSILQPYFERLELLLSTIDGRNDLVSLIKEILITIKDRQLAKRVAEVIEGLEDYEEYLYHLIYSLLEQLTDEQQEASKTTLPLSYQRENMGDQGAIILPVQQGQQTLPQKPILPVQ